MPASVDEAERKKRFADYILYWMRENNQRTPREVQDRSRKVGEGISDALIAKFLNCEKEDCNVSSIAGLADGLTRPPEEVFLAFLGLVAPASTKEYRESETAHLWHLIRTLPHSERKFYTRLLKMAYTDVVALIDSLKPE